MVKVKLFDEEHELDLEDEINQFLEENPIIVLQINYQVAMAHNGKEMEYAYSCMILYNECE